MKINNNRNINSYFRSLEYNIIEMTCKTLYQNIL